MKGVCNCRSRIRRPRTRRPILTAVFSYALLGSSVALAQTLPIDHFLCFRSKRFETVDVTLTDPFDSGMYDGEKAKRFCTPADKNQEGLLDPDTHLTPYQVRGPSVKRAVTVTNQFGTFEFKTRRTDRLMVPTAKSLFPAPPPGLPDPGSDVDHYRCVKISETSTSAPLPPGLSVTAQDQFGFRTLDNFRPKHLCVATDKNGEGVKNPGAHLLCYRVSPQPKLHSTDGVQVHDQFGEADIEVSRERDFCLPSTIEPAPCPGTAKLTMRGGYGDTCLTNGDCTPYLCDDLIGRCRTDTELDAGWTGEAHDRDVNDRAKLYADVSCPGGPEIGTCGQCNVTGFDCQGDGCRCDNDTRSVCDVPFTLDPLCSGGTCVPYVGPPVSVSAGGEATCVVTELAADVSGTLDVDDGSGQLDVSANAVVHSGISVTEPCPYCTGDTTACDGSRDGTCVGGPDDGLSCDVGGTSGCFPAPGGDGHSLDCMPDPLTTISGTGLRVDMSLTTGTSKLKAALFCEPPFDTEKCWCKVCSGDTTLACDSDEVCAGAGAGTCSSTGSGVATAPNACTSGTCVEISGEEGKCSGGQSDTFCDGVLACDAAGIIPCTTNTDCAMAGAGTCTVVEQRECFVDPIKAKGDADTVRPVYASAFCVPPTTSAGVNGSRGYPGPARLVQQTELELFCASDPGTTYTPGVGGCPP